MYYSSCSLLKVFFVGSFLKTRCIKHNSAILNTITANINRCLCVMSVYSSNPAYSRFVLIQEKLYSDNFIQTKSSYIVKYLYPVINFRGAICSNGQFVVLTFRPPTLWKLSGGKTCVQFHDSLYDAI